MKNYLWIVVVFSLMLSLFGCKEGDPTALKQAVKAAGLDISSITVEPTDGTIKTGYSYQYTAIGHRDDGTTIDISSDVNWTTSNNAIATVDADGKVLTGADGSVVISASLASLSGNTSLTASSAVLQDITVLAETNTPTDLSVFACRNLQLKAIGTYADGVRDSIPITDYVAWDISPGDVDVADVSPKGLLRTHSSGTIGVQTSLDGVDVVTNVNSTEDLTTIDITPMSRTLYVDQTQQYTATGTYSDTSTYDITQNVVWNSDTALVAEFNDTDPKGLLTALSEGSSAITAACGMVTSGLASLTVKTEVLNYIRLEDSNSDQVSTLTIAVNRTEQLALIAVYTSGNEKDVTEDAQWSLLDTPIGIITVSDDSGSKGLVRALAVGQASVKATYQQLDKVLSVTVVQQ